jgi:hypothetical protein
MLFGRARGPSRFVQLADFEANLRKQLELAPQTLGELRKHGVSGESSLRLEFFFYTNSREKAQALDASLDALRYQSSVARSAHDRRQFVVSGWSTPIRMDEADLLTWTENMCRLGLEKDCEFDGWGTLLDQTQIPNTNPQEHSGGT